MKIYRNISVLAMAALVATTGFTSCSEDDLDTNQYGKGGVNILAFGPMPVTRGATIRLTGTQLNNVKEVLFPEGNQKLIPSTTFINAEFNVKNSQEMDVIIPDQCVPGKLCLVTNGGDTIVSASNITFSEEIKVSSVTPASVHPGDVVTIKGEYVWNIGQVVFFDHVTVDAAEFLKNTRNEIQVRVPAEAKSGELAYNDGSEGAENVGAGNLSVDFIQITGVSNATPDFGNTITINGANLDLVTGVEFPAVGEVDYTVAADGKSLQVTVPMTTVSGTVTLSSASGITATCDITVPMAFFESITPNKDVKAGMTLTITGQNLDRIVEMIVPGLENPMKKGEFNQSATQISFVVPEEMTDGKIKMKQHDNHTIETSAVMMYSESPEQAIWVGEFVCSGWNGNQDMAWGGFDWTTIAANTVVKFYYKKNNPGNWGCISLRHGTDWAALPDPIPGQYDLDEDEGILSVTFTQNVLDDIIANNGLVITGDNYTLTKVTVPAPVSEIVFWKNAGEGVVSWSGTYRFALEGHDGANECLAEFPQDVWDKIKTGTFYLQYKPEDVNSYQVRFTNGWWDVQWLGKDVDIAPWSMTELITDNGDGTFEIKVNFGSDPIVGTLDEKHLLITGNGFTPLKLYFK
ncbi:MAG: hypothetical protein K6A96_05950 [Prevotella sp.]|nr:hypothetical protein [Prevotella sp.]